MSCEDLTRYVVGSLLDEMEGDLMTDADLHRFDQCVDVLFKRGEDCDFCHPSPCTLRQRFLTRREWVASAMEEGRCAHEARLSMPCLFCGREGRTDWLANPLPPQTPPSPTTLDPAGG